MLQPGKKFDVKEKKVYPPLPEDIYQVELLDITEETVPDKQFPGNMQEVLTFQFVVLDAGEYRGRSLFRRFVPTYLWRKNNEKNALYQITKALICRDMTDDEISNFGTDQINMLVGYQLRVGTIQKAGTGKNAAEIYTNIDKFLPKKEMVERLTADEREKARVKKDRDEVQQPVVADSTRENPETVTIDFLTAVKALGGKEIPNDDIPVINVPESAPNKVSDVPY